jgi:hypothetical protein
VKRSFAAGPKLWWTLPLLASVLVVAVSLPSLGRGSLWSDEIASPFFAELPRGDFLKLIAGREINQSFYYVLLRGWLAFSHSEFHIRMLSMIFGVLAVWTFLIMARRLAGARVAAFGTLALASNGFFLEYCQEARAYGLLFFLVCLATLLFVRLIEQPNARRALIYALCGIVLGYTHLFGFLTLAAHAATVLLTRPRLLRHPALLGSWMLIAVGAVPIAWSIMHFGRGGIFWLEPPHLEDIYYAFYALTGRGGEPIMLAYAGLFLLAAWRLVREYRAVRRIEPLMPLVLAWCMFLVPIALAFAASQFTPVFVARYLNVVLPGMALLAGFGITFGRGRWQPLLLLMLLSLSLLTIPKIAVHQGRQDWRGATVFLQNSVPRGEPLVFYTPWVARNYLYYVTRTGGTPHEPPIAYPQASGYELAVGFEIPDPPRDLAARLALEYPRVWLVLNFDWGPYQPGADAVRASFEDAFERGPEHKFDGGIHIIEFIRKPRTGSQ